MIQNHGSYRQPAKRQHGIYNKADAIEREPVTSSIGVDIDVNQKDSCYNNCGIEVEEKLMSILSYVVIAKPSQARELTEDFLSKKFVWLDFRLFNGSSVQALYSVLCGNPAACQECTATDKVLPLVYLK